MEFEWDEAKSERNRIERGLPFRLVVELFEGFIREDEDLRRDYGERRMIAVGQVMNEVLVCIYTDRNGRRRIVSLRRANRKERHAYRTSQLSRRGPRPIA